MAEMYKRDAVKLSKQIRHAVSAKEMVTGPSVKKNVSNKVMNDAIDLMAKRDSSIQENGVIERRDKFVQMALEWWGNSRPTGASTIGISSSNSNQVLSALQAAGLYNRAALAHLSAEAGGSGPVDGATKAIFVAQCRLLPKEAVLALCHPKEKLSPWRMAAAREAGLIDEGPVSGGGGGIPNSNSCPLLFVAAVLKKKYSVEQLKIALAFLQCNTSSEKDVLEPLCKVDAVNWLVGNQKVQLIPAHSLTRGRLVSALALALDGVPVNTLSAVMAAEPGPGLMTLLAEVISIVGEFWSEGSPLDDQMATTLLRISSAITGLISPRCCTLLNGSVVAYKDYRLGRADWTFSFESRTLKGPSGDGAQRGGSVSRDSG